MKNRKYVGWIYVEKSNGDHFSCQWKDEQGNSHLIKESK